MIRFDIASPLLLPQLVGLDAAASAWPWAESALRRYLAQDQLLSAWDGAELVGFLVAQSILDETSLLHLVVSKECQGQGMGTRIMASWLRTLSAEGQLRCLLEVRESNAPALRLYRKMGFREVGRRPGYYPTPTGTETALVMAVDIREARATD